MAQPNIKIIGMANVSSFLKGKSKEVIDKANKGIHEAGFFMEGEVVASISGQRAEPQSVDTGRFRGSVSTDNSKKLKSSVGTNVGYADTLEYGTSTRPARHHFRNSAKRNEQKVVGYVKAEVNKI